MFIETSTVFQVLVRCLGIRGSTGRNEVSKRPFWQALPSNPIHANSRRIRKWLITVQEACVTCVCLPDRSVSLSLSPALDTQLVGIRGSLLTCWRNSKENIMTWEGSQEEGTLWRAWAVSSQFGGGCVISYKLDF